MFRSLTEILELLNSKQLSSSELVSYYLNRIHKYNHLTRSYITICGDQILEAAKMADKKRALGITVGKLHGVPIAVKDLINTFQVRTTAGSKLLENYISKEDAIIWKRLKDEGALLLGKLNLHEFACGTTSENPTYGTCRNPWDLTRIAGGSSSGCAVALATDLTPVTIGTDSTGSIRIPAAYCGMVGLKPTYGRVSNKGIIPLSYSLDHTGPMTKSVSDAVTIMSIISENICNGQFTIKKENNDFGKFLGETLRGLKIGLDESYLLDNADGEMIGKVFEVIDIFKSESVIVKKVRIGKIEKALEIVSIIASYESYDYHKENLNEKYEAYSEDARVCLEYGNRFSYDDYVKALEEGVGFRNDIINIFDDIDILVLPTIPIVAPKANQLMTRINGKRFGIRDVLKKFTAPFNIAGVPAITVSCGLSKKGIPIGIQLVSSHYNEARLFHFANILEQSYSGMRSYEILDSLYE